MYTTAHNLLHVVPSTSCKYQQQQQQTTTHKQQHTNNNNNQTTNHKQQPTTYTVQVPAGKCDQEHHRTIAVEAIQTVHL